MSLQELVNNLRSFLPPEAVLYETEDLRPYECDGLSAYRQLPLVVVLPRTEEQKVKKPWQYENPGRHWQHRCCPRHG